MVVQASHVLHGNFLCRILALSETNLHCSGLELERQFRNGMIRGKFWIGSGLGYERVKVVSTPLCTQH